MAIRPTLLFVCLLALPVYAQDDDQELKERTKIVSATAEPATAKPGDVVQLVFKLKIDPDWHIYSPNGTYAPTEWSVESPFERAGKVVEPAPKHHRESIGKGDDGKDRFLDYDYHEGEVTFRVPVKINAGATPGPLKVKGKITGQECDPRICVGIDLNFAVDLTVAGDKSTGITTPPPFEGHTRVVSVTVEPAKVKVGETFHLVFKLAIEPDWHIYSANGTYSPTKFEINRDDAFERVGAIQEPTPKHHRESLGKDDDGKEEFLEYDYHEGEVTFRVPYRVGNVNPFKWFFNWKLTGQECDPKVCVPLELTGRVQFIVEEGGVAAPPAPPAPVAQQTPKSSGMGAILAWAVVGGLVSLVMPCVYPLLPITLTYFLKQGGESRSKSVAMSTAYALGIVIVFTGVGFLFSVLLGADGPRIFGANPWVNIAVALLFFWFAFSLFGLYEINLPSWLTGAVTGQQRSGIAGAFILGALFSVVTFTCTIPFAANILTVAASSRRKSPRAHRDDRLLGHDGPAVLLPGHLPVAHQGSAEERRVAAHRESDRGIRRARPRAALHGEGGPGDGHGHPDAAGDDRGVGGRARLHGALPARRVPHEGGRPARSRGASARARGAGVHRHRGLHGKRLQRAVAGRVRHPPAGQHGGDGLEGRRRREEDGGELRRRPADREGGGQAHLPRVHGRHVT
jgi:cytochrome c biogenesis protein CcdA